MRSLVARIALVVAICAALTDCNRNNTPPSQPAPAPAPAVSPTAPPAAPQPPPIPPGTEQPVASINSVTLNRPQDSPGSLIIDVTGTTPSSGWTNPHLAEDTEASDPSVRTYKFVATSPQTETSEQAPEMIDAELRVDSVPAQVKSIRVLSASNEISAPVTE